MWVTIAGDAISFNSLQTGKWSQRKRTLNAERIAFLLFQFPSNGKVEPKINQAPKEMQEDLVSIPFKRESGAKVFQRKNASRCTKVSIPFKRESGAKDLYDIVYAAFPDL